jgi:hypothetical protein
MQYHDGCDANNYMKLNGTQPMIRVINQTYQQKMPAKLGDMNCKGCGKKWLSFT